jgi:hypothetical protein
MERLMITMENSGVQCIVVECDGAAERNRRRADSSKDAPGQHPAIMVDVFERYGDRWDSLGVENMRGDGGVRMNRLRSGGRVPVAAWVEERQGGLVMWCPTCTGRLGKRGARDRHVLRWVNLRPVLSLLAVREPATVDPATGELEVRVELDELRRVVADIASRSK